jgi:hypothetical protein
MSVLVLIFCTAIITSFSFFQARRRRFILFHTCSETEVKTLTYQSFA